MDNEAMQLVMLTVGATGVVVFIGNRALKAAWGRWLDYRTARAVTKARAKYSKWPPPPGEVPPGAAGGGSTGVGAAQEKEIGELWGKASGHIGYPDTLADTALAYFRNLYGWDVHRVKNLEPDMFFVMRHQLQKWIETGVPPHKVTEYRTAPAYIDKATPPPAGGV